MPFVYILKSARDNGFYVGSTRNLDDRLKRHLNGRSKSTKNRLPLELIYKKEFSNYSEAYQFEMHIKKQKSKKFIENLIKDNK
ncbi:GIY-YIG nuclease family protein [Candidatus Parcubacteria bacterium]|nr:GIY-YIG nuclease family protein [Patescibacteria group bacterium]MCG2693982.1 GIY-YIG nuclease family protein [Candidatus Parcubacteria bacterium]